MNFIDSCRNGINNSGWKFTYKTRYKQCDSMAQRESELKGEKKETRKRRGIIEEINYTILFFFCIPALMMRIKSRGMLHIWSVS